MRPGKLLEIEMRINFMNEDKIEVLNEILKCSPIHRRINSEMYRIRCPICGDSTKNDRDMHCYIKCSDDPNEPLLYYCFLCNSHGKIGKWFLNKLGVDQKIVNKVGNTKYNRLPSIKTSNIEIITGDPVMDSPQVMYIKNRLGPGFTYDDYSKFKILWNIENVVKYIRDDATRHTLPDNRESISFLSDDRTAMMTRTFLDSSKLGHQWRKIRILPSHNHTCYTIKVSLDLFTKETIYVNIAEGIFDILSVYKNFNDGPNSVFFAALGSDYISTLEYAILRGFVGNNIVIKIYIDQGINEKELYSYLREMKWMFNSIYVYKNIKGKDVGERIDTIKLQEKRI